MLSSLCLSCAKNRDRQVCDLGQNVSDSSIVTGHLGLVVTLIFLDDWLLAIADSNLNDSTLILAPSLGSRVSHYSLCYHVRYICS